jgi:hypothetical protein
MVLTRPGRTRLEQERRVLKAARQSEKQSFRTEQKREHLVGSEDMVERRVGPKGSWSNEEIVC